MSEPAARVLDLRAFAVCLVGNQWVGMCTLAGIPIRGRGAADPVRAMQNLLWQFSGAAGDDNATMALEMALAGVDLNVQLTKLVDSGALPADNTFALPDHADRQSAQRADGYRELGQR